MTERPFESSTPVVPEDVSSREAEYQQFEGVIEREHALRERTAPRKMGKLARFIMASSLAMGLAASAEKAEAGTAQAPGGIAPRLEVAFILTLSQTVAAERMARGPIAIVHEVEEGHSYQLRVRARKLVRVDTFGGKAYSLQDLAGNFEVAVKTDLSEHPTYARPLGRIPISYEMHKGQDLLVRLPSDIAAAYQGAEIIVDAIQVITPAQ